MRIAFLVGDLFNVSGGSNVIVEYASGLERLGHEVVIVTGDRVDPRRGGWHPRLAGLRVVHLTEAGGSRFDFAFATWWITWFDLWRVDARVYGYFNQSLESRFHAERRLKLLNRITYSLPLLFVTEARWIAELVEAVRPGAPVLQIRNGLSREHFPRVKAPPIRGGPLRVLVEGPWDVPFKGVPETFRLLETAAPRVEMAVGWLTAGSCGVKPRIGGRPVAVHERIPIDRVRLAYQQYDVLVKLSRVEGMYGPPLEMFSQGGTAITTTVTGCDEYLVHGENGLLVQPYDVWRVPRYLEILQRSPDYLAHLRRGALATAEAWPAWERPCAELARRLAEVLASGYSNADLRPAISAASSWRDQGHGTWPDPTVLGRMRGTRVWQVGKRIVPAGIRRRIRAWLGRASA